MFRLAQTFYEPEDSQSGFAEPGAGAQTVGDPSWQSLPVPTISETPERPTKGVFSWLFPNAARGGQTGQPEPQNALQHRLPGSMDNVPPIYGNVGFHETPNYSRGAGAFVPITGKVLTNPIGAGVVALQRPQASYGPGGQYIDHTIFWASQSIPTNVGLNGLLSAEQIEALVGNMSVQAMVRIY